MDILKKSLLLLNACGSYDARVMDHLETLGISPGDINEASPSMMDRIGMSAPARRILADSASSGWGEAEWERCEKKGIRIIFFTDDAFPVKLKSIIDPPLLLYSRGKGLPSGEMVAVVGTRKCTTYGMNCARILGSSLASAGIPVVSGGARGIDGSAHRGCLESGGRTVAVLGTGVDIAYPGSHRGLFEEIMAEGVLLSEYPLGSSGLPWHFPRRNRIIAGLCSRCVVVEAPEKSGAISTARFALEAGREVWAVPGRINENSSKGSNALISDGALPLVDIMEFAGIASGRQMNLFLGTEGPAGQGRPSLTDEEGLVYGILADNSDLTVDNIASRGKMGAAAILRALGMLSIYGLVFRSGPGRWSAAVPGNSGSAR